MRTVLLFSLLLTLSLQAGEKTKLVGVMVYDGLTISEVTAPLEVYGMADADGKPRFEVVLIGENKEPVTSHEGLRFFPDETFRSCPALDVLVVPGSYRPDRSEDNPLVHQFIRKQLKNVTYTTSHCAGAFVLGRAGVLDGRRVTTYASGEPLLQKKFPLARVTVGEENYVVDRGLVTSKGALVSYEASLWVVAQIAGRSHADYVASRLYLDRLGD